MGKMGELMSDYGKTYEEWLKPLEALKRERDILLPKRFTNGEISKSQFKKRKAELHNEINNYPKPPVWQAPEGGSYKVVGTVKPKPNHKLLSVMMLASLCNTKMKD